MARQYYYLVASLPEISFDIREPKDLNLEQYKSFIWENIHSNDRQVLEAIAYPIDNKNLLSFLYKEKSVGIIWQNGGNYTLKEMEDNMELKEIFPKYMKAFIELFEEDRAEKKQLPDKKEMERELFKKFYTSMEKNRNKFIRNWYKLDREIRNITAAYAARLMNVSFSEYLIGNDDITELLEKSNASDFGLLNQRDYMSELLQIFETNDLLDREYKLDLFRWEQIDKMLAYDYFTVNVVAGFLQKISIVERWLKLDKSMGVRLLSKLVKEMKDTYKDELAKSIGN